MRKSVGLAVVLVLGGAALAGAVSWRYGFPAPAHQVLVLGTFHFKDAGLDSYKPEHDIDILSDKRQTELAAVLDCLAVYEPTKIAVEMKAERQGELDTQYRSYLDGELELTSDEIHQLGFRLAKRLGHSRLYAIDADARWYEPWVDPDEYAREHGQGELLETPLVGKYEELYRSEDAAKTRQDLTATLIAINNPRRVNLGHGRYVIENFPAGTSTEYPGVDSKTAWYNRNLRIFANIQRIAVAPAERILVIIGGGHLPILRHAIGASPEYELADVHQYLDYSCTAAGKQPDESLARIVEIAKLNYVYLLDELLTHQEHSDRGFTDRVEYTALFLKIRLNGTPNDRHPRYTLRVVAQKGDEVVLDQSFRPSFGKFIAESLDTQGNYTVPVLIHGPFCDPVRVRVTLEATGHGVIDQETYEQHFRCGE